MPETPALLGNDSSFVIGFFIIIGLMVWLVVQVIKSED